MLVSAIEKNAETSSSKASAPNCTVRGISFKRGGPGGCESYPQSPQYQASTGHLDSVEAAQWWYRAVSQRQPDRVRQSAHQQCQQFWFDRRTGRGERIRTSGLYVPNVALYQAKLHPDLAARKRATSSPASRTAKSNRCRPNAKGAVWHQHFQVFRSTAAEHNCSKDCRQSDSGSAPSSARAASASATAV